MTRLYDITVERVKEPLAVKREGVRFGWRLESDEKDVFQTSCTVTVSLDGQTVWEGRYDGSRTVDVTSDAVFLTGKK